MLNTLRKRLHGEEGFTLIELLVVILIIGILAAIAIPSFLNQKSKGEDSKAKADARTTQTALETFYTDNQNYDCSAGPCITAGGTGSLQKIEAQVPGNATVATLPAGQTGAGVTGYTVTVTSTNSRTFSITKDPTTGILSRTCTISASGANAGGCKITSGTSGTW